MRNTATLALVALLAACTLAGGPVSTVDQGADPTSSTEDVPQATTPATGSTPSSTAASAAPSEGGDHHLLVVCSRCRVEAITFTDQSAALGLVEPLIGMHGHAALGDTDGDGMSDLVVGTFANRPPTPTR